MEFENERIPVGDIYSGTERVHYLIKLAIELILVTNEITLFIMIKISSEVIESVDSIDMLLRVTMDDC